METDNFRTPLKFPITSMKSPNTLILNSLLLVFSLVSLTSCVDTIQLDLREVEPQLVIEGKITNTPSENEVIITTSVDFQLKNEFPPITTAVVSLTDQTTGESEELIQTSAGVYAITTLKGIEGHTYALKVAYNGQIYSATSTMPQQVNFEELTYEEGPRRPQNNSQTRMVAIFKDPASTENHYRWVSYRNGIQSRTVFVRSDAFTNGNSIRQSINSDIDIAANDAITVEMQCISKEAYEYFNTLMRLQGDGVNQGTTPTNPPSNIVGGALGYFSAYTSQKQTVVIKP